MSKPNFPPLYEPEHPSYVDYVNHYAQTTPAATASIENNQPLSYQALLYNAQCLAQKLAQQGIKKGDRVSALVPPSNAFLISFLACNLLEAIWVGINPKYKPNEIDHVLTIATPKIIIVKPTATHSQHNPITYNYIAQLKTPVFFLETDYQGITSEPCHFPGKPTDTAMLVFTSGTSGKPKAAKITHQAMTIAARRRVSVWAAKPIRIVNYLPVNHIGGASDITGTAIISGGTLVFQEYFDPRALLSLIEKHQLTVLPGVPTSLHYCAEHFEDYDLSSLQLIIFSGGPASQSLLGKFNTVTPKTLTSYGMTESSASITMAFPVDDATQLEDFIGFPTPEFSFRLQGNRNEGEIEVTGPTVIRGYWSNAKATQEAFTEDGWYKTGDIARQLNTGGYQLIGRAKEMFKSGGYNVYPREIEQALELHPDIDTAIVVAVPSSIYNEVGYAFISCNKHRQISQGEVLEYSKEKLANYKIPKFFYFEQAIPTLANGKPDRNALKRKALVLLPD